MGNAADARRQAVLLDGCVAALSQASTVWITACGLWGLVGKRGHGWEVGPVHGPPFTARSWKGRVLKLITSSPGMYTGELVERLRICDRERVEPHLRSLEREGRVCQLDDAWYPCSYVEPPR